MFSASTNHISLILFYLDLATIQPWAIERFERGERERQWVFVLCACLDSHRTSRSDVKVREPNQAKPSRGGRRLTDIIWLSGFWTLHWSATREDRVITCGHLQVLCNIVCFISYMLWAMIGTRVPPCFALHLRASVQDWSPHIMSFWRALKFQSFNCRVGSNSRHQSKYINVKYEIHIKLVHELYVIYVF
jgi:hypothetical protein